MHANLRPSEKMVAAVFLLGFIFFRVPEFARKSYIALTVDYLLWYNSPSLNLTRNCIMLYFCLHTPIKKRSNNHATI